MAYYGSVSVMLSCTREQLAQVSGDRSAGHELFAFLAIMRGLLKADLAARPVISSSASLQAYLSAEMAGNRSEQVRVLFLDVKSRLIADEKVFSGTIDSTTFSPREIIHRALELNTTSMIVVHNHPSGDPAPSERDLRGTRELVAAASLFGMDVVDHLIVASGGIISILNPDYSL